LACRSDIELIAANAVKYNVEGSEVCQDAAAVVETVKAKLAEAAGSQKRRKR
jgi:hypothetical protein